MPNWLAETRTVSVEEEAVAADFEDSAESEKSTRGPEPIAVPIARMPDGVSRRTTTALSSESPSTWDRTLGVVSPGPDKCNAFVVAAAASPVR